MSGNFGRHEGHDGAPGSGATAVLFLTHILHEDYVARYRRLEREVPSDHEVHLVFNATEASRGLIERARRLGGDRLHLFRFSELSTAGYPSPWAGDNVSGLVPGNVDLLFLDFHRSERAYSRYWLVEPDVCYTGDWKAFFEHFDSSDAGLLGTTLQPYSILPEFHWWDSLDAPEPVGPEDLYRGFFPVMRLSARALDVLHRAYAAGWSGHHEVVLPTAFRRFGVEIEDIGGNGPFVPPGNENRFYTNTPWRTGLGPGTFIYRPSRRWPGISRGKLWHPVKPTQGRAGQYVELFSDWFRARFVEGDRGPPTS